MRRALLALAVAAFSSTAQAKLTELACHNNEGGPQFFVSINDETERATISTPRNGSTYAHLRAAFTPDQVSIDWDPLTLAIDRSTLHFHLASPFNRSVETDGTCSISQNVKRQF